MPQGQVEMEIGFSEPQTQRVRMVTEARHTFGTRAAGQLWFKLALPVVPAMLDEPAQRELFGSPSIQPIK